MIQTRQLRSFGVCAVVGLAGCSANQKVDGDQNVGGSQALGGTTATPTSNGGTGQTARGGTGTTHAVGGSGVGGTSVSNVGGGVAAGGSLAGTGTSGGTAGEGGSSGTTTATSARGGAGFGGGAAKGGATSAGTAGKGGAAAGGVAGASVVTTGGAAAGGVAGSVVTTGGVGKGGAATGGTTTTGVAGSATGGAGKGGAATGGTTTTGVAGNATGGISVAGASDVPTGNPDGKCAIPAEAGPADIASGTKHVVGTGTKESCTGDAFIAAVALGGVITFDCGADPITITLTSPAKIFNDTGPEIVIDGGGLVTLSGGGTTRILYMNTCDEAQHWTTSHCDNQDSPHLTVQNLTFIDANSKNETENDGGGAIFAQGGRFRAVNCRFFKNACADTGPDVGGAGIRVFQQYEGMPAYVVNSTFGGKAGLGNVCSNGGGISSIGVSWIILNSLFSYNQAIGNGGNPADTGTPGGGSGGAIYNDGNTMTLSLCGTLIENNTVKAYGGAIFFVSNSHTGTINITDSVIRNNPGGSWYPNPNAPGISMHEDTVVNIVNSTISE
jgi:hypothetical protein